MKVAIYGIGNFGFALLKHLDKYASEDFDIRAYDRKKELRDNLKEKRKHLFFHRNFSISKKIIISENIQELVQDADILILAVNSYATREVIINCKPFLKKGVIILNTVKALDYKTGKPLSEIVKKELLSYEKFSYAVISGGTIAKDLFMHEPLGLDLASNNEKVLHILRNLLESETLSVYTCKDVIGLEYAGAFKNIISIFSGIIHGLGFSYGSETHIISKAGEEAGELIVNKFKGRKETFSIGSQCWGNDMWMSCTGNTRNKEFGVLIGKGNTFEEAKNIMASKNKTVEEINTLITMKKAIGDLSNYTYLNAVYQIVLNNKEPRKIIKDVFKKKMNDKK